MKGRSDEGGRTAGDPCHGRQGTPPSPPRRRQLWGGAEKGRGKLGGWRRVRLGCGAQGEDFGKGQAAVGSSGETGVPGGMPQPLIGGNSRLATHQHPSPCSPAAISKERSSALAVHAFITLGPVGPTQTLTCAVRGEPGHQTLIQQ